MNNSEPLLGYNKESETAAEGWLRLWSKSTPMAVFSHPDVSYSFVNSLLMKDSLEHRISILDFVLQLWRKIGGL